MARKYLKLLTITGEYIYVRKKDITTFQEIPEGDKTWITLSNKNTYCIKMDGETLNKLLENTNL